MLPLPHTGVSDAHLLGARGAAIINLKPWKEMTARREMPVETVN